MFDHLHLEGIELDFLQQIRLCFFQATMRRGISLPGRYFPVL